MTDHLPTWHQKHRESRTLGARVADWIAEFVGSWGFLVIHALWFAFWIMLPVEPYPYGLLTMIVSLEAIFLSTFIMISQNRQVERDRHQALDDYRTNVEAKLEIEQLQKDLARIEIDKLDTLIKAVSELKGR